jgi:nicotinamide mononucleotide transporter
MNEILSFLIEPYKTYDTLQIVLEIIASMLGIASVFFSMKRNIWVYPTGIISTFLFIYLFFNWGLYGESLINFYYTIMSVYGWILWYKNTEEDNVHVKVFWATKSDYLKATGLFIFTFGFIMFIYYYRSFIDSGFDTSMEHNFGYHYTFIDYIDASVTGIFLIGMWFMAKQKVDNWIFWIIGDFIMIPLLLYKGYGISSIQYLVFTILAIKGLIEWRKTANQSVN